MRKTKKPLIGGILSIISGVLGLLGIFSYTVGFGEPGSGIGKGDMPPFVPSIVSGVPAPAIIIAVLAVAGGVLAILKKRWRWALAGAIAAALSMILLGIPAIALISMAREEFE